MLLWRLQKQKNVHKSLISSWVVERSRVKVQRGQNKAAVSWKRRNCNAAIYIYISVCLCAGLWSLLRYKCILLHQGTFGSSGRQAGSQPVRRPHKHKFVQGKWAQCGSQPKWGIYTYIYMLLLSTFLCVYVCSSAQWGKKSQAICLYGCFRD